MNEGQDSMHYHNRHQAFKQLLMVGGMDKVLLDREVFLEMKICVQTVNFTQIDCGDVLVEQEDVLNIYPKR
jgi:aspartyl-tRNA synthetase